MTNEARYGDGVDPVEDQLVGAEQRARNMTAAWSKLDEENRQLRARLVAAEERLAEAQRERQKSVSAIGWLKEAVAFRDAKLVAAESRLSAAVEALGTVPRLLEIVQDQAHIVDARARQDICHQGLFGILAHTDELARRYQRLDAEREAIRSKIDAALAKEAKPCS